MPQIKLYNLARMTVSSTGTGTITLNSAVSGFATFANAGVTNGDIVNYAINDTTQSEIGYGTYTSTGGAITLTRNITRTSAGSTSAAIDMSNAAQVFITPSAENLGIYGQFPGTTTNDSAATGNVGEYITATIPSTTTSTMVPGTTHTLTSINLTPGEWEVFCNFTTSVGGGAALISAEAGISSASGTLPTRGLGRSFIVATSTGGSGGIGGQFSQNTPNIRVQVASGSTDTYYLIAQITTTSTASQGGYGILVGRRVR